MSTHPSLLPCGGSEPLMDMKSLSTTLPTATLPREPPFSEPIFNRSRHTTYWLRCARTFLPNAYESGDASRMLLAFFIVSALDLLGLLDKDTSTGLTKITDEEKQGWIDWIYLCQHQDGGFRGFTGTTTPKKGHAWDPANLPASFFALCALLVLGDDLERVDREACLRWIGKLQRDDGSFGELLGDNNEIEGGRDLRFCCCAIGILYMLHEVTGEDEPEVIEIGNVVDYITSCQSYEGGFSEGPYREAHSGLNYCAIGALSLLGTLPFSSHHPPECARTRRKYESFIDIQACVEWMVKRQTTYIKEDEAEGSEEGENIHANAAAHLFAMPQDGSTAPEDLGHAGFNGRTNKVADTCYAFWNVGALALLDDQDLIDQDRLRRYLLKNVQHAIGGFGKGVGEPPDVLHAYLGLATLSILGMDQLKPIDPTLCISRDAVDRIGDLSWKKPP